MDHGVASIGVSVALRNGYGMQGMVYGATLKMIGACNSNGTYVIADAINHAVANTTPGDIILLEQQATSSTAHAYCPIEYYSDVYSAIVNATALGRIVIEPAGNSGRSLDDPVWGNAFQRSLWDSRAIMVGAGTAARREKCDFSNYGSRVDIQGWGDWSVAALGYGDLYGTTTNNRYTIAFSGTSSASALSAGAAASLQSYTRAKYGYSLPPLAVRSNLVRSGYAQTFGPAGNIGPLPNLSNAYHIVDMDDPDGDTFPSWAEYKAGTDPNSRTSYFKMVAFPYTNPNRRVVLSWLSTTGRLYSLERSTNGVAYSSYKVLASHISGRQGTTSYTDTTATAKQPRFYRTFIEP
jgi:hypothetical protein